MDLDTPNTIKYRLLSVGDTLVDEFLKIPDSEGEVKCELDQQKEVVSFPYGRKILAESINYSLGGNAVNNAVGMSRLGIKTTLLSTIGGDWTSKMVLDGMAHEAIGTSLISTQSEVPGARGVIVSYLGERTLFGYHPKFLYKVPEQLPEVEWVYLSSMGEGYEEVYGGLVTQFKKIDEKKRPKLAFNPGTKQLVDGVEKWRDVLSICDILFVNKEEAARILGKGLLMKEGEEAELLRDLAALGPKIVAITDGQDGAYALDGSKRYWSSIYEVPVIETTGAGDAFGVGFMAAIMEGKPIDEALKWGMVESASVITKVGAEAGLLTRSEFEAWLAKADSVKVREI